MDFIEIKGNLNAKGQNPCIVVSRFNEFITESLLKACIQCFEMNGLDKKLTVVRVPGAFEIPSTTNKIALTKKYDSIICLGAVIRGSTPHFDYVAQESSKIGSLSVNYNIPIIYGVLTTDTIEQAIERAGTKAGNKGFESAQTAIEMVNLFKKIDSGIS